MSTWKQRATIIKFLVCSKIAIVAGFICWKLYGKIYKKYHNINGPVGYPFIGSIYSFLNDLHFAKKLGCNYKHSQIISFKVLSQKFVCINNSRLARKIFGLEELTNRAPYITKPTTFRIITATDDKTVPMGLAS